MLIQPNKQWHWVFDTDKGVMTLELGENMLFVSKLCKKRCVQHAQEDSPFTTEHTQLYYQFLEQLEPFNWSDPIKVQICLNAVASAQFLKPLMPQSWFFNTSACIQQEPLQVGELAVLQTESGQARCVIVEVSEQSYTLMAIEGGLKLDERKSLSQFEAIKVMQDRVIPLSMLLHNPNGLAQTG
ncbi:cell division protein ZapC [Agarivorans aestuarii]|uniref:Cell division protein ZapC n=1 Tax=Agarivorans aestuarii TaxID=1563703 RepID=A0ABU7G1H5_9ALTE|nr:MULTISPECIES: cell division protein ZapC domain-containing protein [Agarivorans]MEE1673112.1 cell division protein ZapC [Agarivorans aestuarii]